MKLIKGKVKSEVTGRRLAVSSADYSQALNVAAAGAVAITITPPADELWRIKVFRFSLVGPAGAGSGTHRILVGVNTAGVDRAVLDVSSAYGTSIIIANNVVATGTTPKPTTEATQQYALSNIVVTNASPLVVYYSNATDVTQANTATIIVTREVEYIA